MIPISDRPRARRFPVVNYLLIIATVLVFLHEISLSTRALDRFLLEWGAVPALISSYLSGTSHDPHVPLTLVTSVFLHAGWLHLLGNMLFLWVFGDNVEDSMGHLRYLVFYLICGAVATLTQMVIFPDSRVPLVGASGAVAGVLGAYLILHPTASVTVLMPVLLFLPIDIPAIIVLAVWFVTQFFNGLAAITTASNATGGTGWWAHIGGFVLGAMLIFFFRRRR
ncbi:MAG: rhomboid family intramembrane serine protease [Chloroflexota bacterium]|nr:MAG: rhomboid family intramembrane serine protease [Chloroflexota bacterium]